MLEHPEEQNELDYDNLPSDAPAEVGQYRNPSLLAILTVVLALLSVTALTTPMLWFVPWLAVAIGLVTLGVLKVHPEKMGRRPVILALALATFFGTLPPAKFYSRQFMLEGRAQKYADKWFDLVKKNELDLAYQLHVPRPQRIEKNMSFKEYYKEVPGVKVEHDKFFSTKALQKLITHRPTAKVQYQGIEAFFPGLKYDVLILRYTLNYQEDGQEKRTDLDVEIMHDRRVMDGTHDWYVSHVGLPEDETT